METEARRLSDQKVEDLQQEMGEMRQQMAEMRQMFLASQDSQNITPQQNTSAPQYENEDIGNIGLANFGDEVESNGSMRAMHGHCDTNITRKTTNAEQQHEGKQMNIRAQQGACQIANIGREVDEAESNAPFRRRIPLPQRPNNKQGVGREVILYSITRPINVPVAKGIFRTVDAHALVGGEPLGP